MRNNQEDVSSYRERLISGYFGTERKTLTANPQLAQESPILNFFDPNGSDRDIILPLREPGQYFYIFHVGAANTLTIKDAAGVSVVPLTAGESTLVFASGQEWVVHKAPAWQDLNDFGIAGPNHRRGLVPDPGVTVHDASHRLYLSELGWSEIAEITGDDFIKHITDGLTSTDPVGADTFKIRSSDGSISVTVTNDQAIHGDNVNLFVNQAVIDHDALMNSFPNEHIDHTAVAINTTEGIQGGGNIAATRTLKLDVNGLATIVPVLADLPVFYDVSGAVHGKNTWTAVNAIFDHNALVNFVANKHIDHSTVSISTNTGLAGGGDITASRTISLDFNALPVDDLPVLADKFPFYDADEADHGGATLQRIWNTGDTLTAITAPAIDDKVVLMDTSAATDKGTIITLPNMWKVVNLFTNKAVPLIADKVAIYSAADSDVRAATLDNMFHIINGLTAETAPALADLIALYDTSAAAPRKMTPDNFLKVLNLLTEDTTPDAAADFVLSYDTSASGVKKVKPTNLGASVKAKVTSFTLDQSTTGSQSITGVGFQPKALIILACQNGTAEISIGIATSIATGGVAQNSNAAADRWDTETFIATYETAGNVHRASLTSMDADGFTLNKTRTGTPTGTTTCFYLAIG